MKKAISFLLALVMALSLLPAAVWADNEAGGDTSGGNAGGESNALQVGGCTVYYATSVSDDGVVYCNANVNNTAKLGENGEISAFKVAGAVANEKYYVVVMWGENTSPEIRLKPRINGEEISSSQTGNYSNKTVFELTVPEVGDQGDTVVDFDLWVNESSNYSFGVIFAKKNDNPGQDGINDCISAYEVVENGVIITELRNLNRDTIEMVVEWREALSEVQRVGLPIGVIGQLAKNGKSVTLYNFRGVQLHLSAAVLGDIAGKLSDGNGTDKLWVVTDFARDNGSEESMASVRSFRIQLYLNDECTEVYQPGENLNYALGCTTAVSDATYAVFAVPGEEDAAPVKTDISVDSRKNEWEEDGAMRSELNHTFPVTTGGFYIVAPADFDFTDKQWLWETDEPEEPWEPTGGIVPANAPENLKELYDAGFKFPTVDVNGASEKADIHFTFPEILKAWDVDCGDDWDYRLIEEDDTGTIRIQANMGDRGRWEQTVRGNDDILDDGVFFRYYFGNSDNWKPMSYGYDWYGGYSEDASLGMEGRTLREQYNHNNGLHLASVNRVNAYSSVLTLNSEGEDWSIILAMDEEEKTVNSAACKYALRLVIEPCESMSFTLSADNGTAVEKERIEIVEDSVHGDWEAFVPADGTVFLRPKNAENRKDAGTAQDGIIAKMNVGDKDGYTLQRWSNSAGPEGNRLPVSLFKDDYQTIRLIWKDADGNIVTEYVRVECHNKAEWFRSLGDDGTDPQASIFTGDELTELEKNGIHVTYAENIGYFAVSVDASKLTDVDLLQKKVYLTHPECELYFKDYTPGVSENPATHDVEDSVSEALEIFEDKDMIAASIEEYGDPSMSLVQVKELRLGDLTVYYTDFQMYRNLIVQWLDADKKVIGYSYVYGRNGDFVTAVDTAVVDKLDNEEVEVPTLVTDKENLQFTCDKNPQTGSEDGRKLFLQFEVMGNSGENGPVYTVYLPYEYFNMTKEQGLALAAQGIKPAITHYLDDACTTTKPIIDSAYTEYGVMIVTDSFSPYVIDCSATGDDDTTPPRYYYSSGSGSSDSTITSGADQTKQAGDIVKVTVKSGAKVQTVYVDGVALSAGEYIISGGTVKLQGTYTVKLAQGSHTLRIAYSDGSAVSTTFTLKGTTAPKTGDAGIAVYAVMALGGCTGAAALAFRRKRED